jgi:diacylglycerol kinase (ATP)
VHGTIYEFEALPRVVHTPAVARASSRVPIRVRSAPLIGVIRNPRSHRNKGTACGFADRPDILVRTPATRAALREELAEFARRGVDYLVVDGGDGTVRDVLTCGDPVFAGRWPKLVVLPKGKTNALAVDLGLPNVWSLAEALDAIAQGRTVERRSLAIELPSSTDRDGRAPAQQVHGFILGAGAFTRCTQAAQQAHRYGAFNSFAVFLTILWCVLQLLFGRITNPWRAGSPMRIALGKSRRPLSDSRPGVQDRRLIAFASTLERFPVGVRPFGRLRSGLKLTVVDAPLRRVMVQAPLIMAGVERASFPRLGVHRVVSQEIELDLGEGFILDGEYFPGGRYVLRQGPPLRFVTP